MCWALYVASDRELPFIGWNPTTPAFYTAPVDGDDPVRHRFSWPYIFYLGSHQGCGCGFANDDPAEDTGRSCLPLVDYLGGIRRSGAKVEIFLCWEGGQGHEVAARRQLDASDFGHRPFPLGEDELASIL